MNVVFFSNLTSPNLTLKLSKQPRILSKYIRIFLEVYSQSCRNSLVYLSRYCHHLSKQYRIGVDVKFCRAKLPIPFSEATHTMPMQLMVSAPVEGIFDIWANARQNIQRSLRPSHEFW
jgi:hypothetical protein